MQCAGVYLSLEQKPVPQEPKGGLQVRLRHQEGHSTTTEVEQ